MLFSKLLFGIGFIFAVEIHGAIPKKTQELPSALLKNKKKSEWLLPKFLSLAESNPRKLVGISEKLFSPSRVRLTTLEPRMAHEWQHRVAAVSALSQVILNSEPQKGVKTKTKRIAPIDRIRAQKVLILALQSDPSLLVRDSAAESIRRILKSKPTDFKKDWKKQIERAFLDPNNVIEGEGLFIRETLLTVLREAREPLSPKIKRAALQDKNPRVKKLAQSI